ncbi:hypothetical protein FSP39_009650, partial [Pinctada imbricata]
DIHALEILGHSSKFTDTLFLYQQQQYLCDCVIIANNGYVPAHRLVLVAGSPFFQQLDSSRNYKSPFDANFTLESDLEDVKTVMRLLYTGKLLVNEENIHRLLKICQLLQLKEAASLCEGYIQANYKKTSAGRQCNSVNVVEHSLSIGYDVDGQGARSRSTEHSNLSHSDKSHSNKPHSDMSHSVKTNIDLDRIVMFEDGKKDKITIGKLENVPSIQSTNSLTSPESFTNDSDYSYVLFPDEDQTDESQNMNFMTPAADEDSRISSSSSATIEDTAEDTTSSKEEDIIGDSMKEEALSLEEGLFKRLKVEEEEPSAKMGRVAQLKTSKKRKREESEENNAGAEREPHPGIPYDIAKFNKELTERKGRKMSCRACKLYFLHIQDLVHHRRNVHPENNTEKRDKYTCDICFQKPNSILRVIEHKFKKHGIPYDTKKYPTIKCGFKNCKFTTIVEQTMRSHVKKSHCGKKSNKLEYVDDTNVEDEEVEEEEAEDREEEESNSHTAVCSNLKMESDHSDDVPVGNHGNVDVSSEENTRFETDELDQRSEKDENLTLSNASIKEDDTSKEKACPAGISYDQEKFQEIMKDRKCRKFSCRVCRLLFLNPNDLWQHRLEVHPENNSKVREKYMCDICFRKPNTIIGVVEHKFKQHGIPYDTKKYPTIKCEHKKCKYTTIIQHNMKKHIKNQHNGKTPDELRNEKGIKGTSDSSSESEDDLTNIPIGDVFISIDDDGEMICKKDKVSDVSDQPPEKCRKRSRSEIEQMKNLSPGIPYKEAAKHEILSDPTVNRYSCRSCKLHFLKPQDLLHHRLTSHPSNKKKEKYTCDICFKKPNSLKALVEHKFKKHNIPYDADLYPLLHCSYETCKFTTIVQQTLKDHVKKVHEQQQVFMCEVCGRESKSLGQHKYHSATHTRTGKEHVCSICGKSCMTVYSLKKHIEEVHQKKRKRFLCHFCPYGTYGLREFHNHLYKVHNEQPPEGRNIFKCEKCDYFTLTKSYLERHMLLHQGAERKYLCPTCNKGFYSMANLKAHERRHKTEPLKCEFAGCDFFTYYKHIMKNHISGKHTNTNLRPYKCHLCNHSCKLKGNLNKHLAGKHGLEVMTQVKQRKIALETGTGFQEILKTCAGARSRHLLRDLV